MERRIFLIANPKAAAGRAATRWRALLESIHSRGFPVDYAVTDHVGHAVELARGASQTHDLVVAVGGDGTVNEVANGILLSGATGATLGIIPFGTGNDVAQQIGIRNFEDGLDALAWRACRSLDVIEVRCESGGTSVTRYALLYASVGFAGSY